jgi:hypothetical protein
MQTGLYQKGVLAMKSRILSATAMILLTPLVVLAFQAQAEQVRKGELKSRPFTQGPLKITLINFSYDSIIVEVENTSNDFTTFDPRLLSFIDKDDNQVNILGVRMAFSVGPPAGGPVVKAEGTRIAPNARIKRSYVLTNYLQLPASLYFEDKLLAMIIK